MHEQSSDENPSRRFLTPQKIIGVVIIGLGIALTYYVYTNDGTEVKQDALMEENLRIMSEILNTSESLLNEADAERRQEKQDKLTKLSAEHFEIFKETEKFSKTDQARLARKYSSEIARQAERMSRLKKMVTDRQQ